MEFCGSKEQLGKFWEETVQRLVRLGAVGVSAGLEEIVADEVVDGVAVAVVGDGGAAGAEGNSGGVAMVGLGMQDVVVGNGAGSYPITSLSPSITSMSQVPYRMSSTPPPSAASPPPTGQNQIVSPTAHHHHLHHRPGSAPVMLSSSAASSVGTSLSASVGMLGGMMIPTRSITSVDVIGASTASHTPSPPPVRAASAGGIGSRVFHGNLTGVGDAYEVQAAYADSTETIRPGRRRTVSLNVLGQLRGVDGVVGVAGVAGVVAVGGGGAGGGGGVVPTNGGGERMRSRRGSIRDPDFFRPPDAGVGGGVEGNMEKEGMSGDGV
ncbi:hypothetical protein HDV00_004110 [Rhizophlyctis rosea]|nr:hypothetical protein HDV00_004110 [Rhizophlyctis rosea]